MENPGGTGYFKCSCSDAALAGRDTQLQMVIQATGTSTTY
ncbi:hypothetical protein FBY30_1979 [Arthrobacter sp. SLBN-83]|nr:hypothetical protein FBY30_1979 [Arthrobacter sp. SLBN-83]